jgi:hypothetical protein
MALAGIDWTRPNVDAERMAEHAREASELLKALAFCLWVYAYPAFLM